MKNKRSLLLLIPLGLSVFGLCISVLAFALHNVTETAIPATATATTTATLVAAKTVSSTAESTTTFTLVYENAALPERVGKVVNETTGVAYAPEKFTRERAAPVVGGQFADYYASDGTHIWVFYANLSGPWPVKVKGDLGYVGRVTAVIYTETNTLLYVEAF